MSCLGSEYNPLPPREWVRFHNRCSQRNELPISASESYLLQMNRKANILQYNNNSARFNKNQKYGQLANRYFKTFGSQTQTYSNPNIKLFERTNETYKVLPNVYVINDNDVTQIQNINCIKDKIQDIFPNLPDVGGGGRNQPIIIPPQPIISPSNPSNPPYIPPPGITIYVVPDGGKLLCNRIQDPCTGDILDKTRDEICFPTSCSDVPGKIELLCWSGREPVYFPKVKRTYGTSGNKWPTNAKFIRTANPPIKINTVLNSGIQQTVNEEIDFINEEIINLNQENQLLDNDTLILNKLDSINSLLETQNLQQNNTLILNKLESINYLLETSNLQQNNTTLSDHYKYIKFLYNHYFRSDPFIIQL